MDNNEINKYLLDVKFPQELEKIPKGELSLEEEIIAEKVKNHEKISEEEFDIIKEVLSRWRGAITKYNVDDIKDAHNKTVEIIKTSKDLISVLDDEDSRKLKLELPYFNKTYVMTFKVKPITDSRALQALNLDLNLFQDYSAYDKQVYAKAQKGAKLSSEEVKIVNHINEELNANIEQNQDELITKFLAHQLVLEGDVEDNLEERITFWEKFPLNQRVTTFMEVERLLGLTEDSDFKLFPTG